MAMSRLLAAFLGPLLVAVALVAFHAQRGDAAPADTPRAAIVAGGVLAGTATRPNGSWRTELPWLEPGDGDIAVSADGRRVAFSSARSGNRELYLGDAVTGALQRLTNSARREDRWPSWSPDGTRIAWSSDRAGHGDVFVMRVDGSRTRLLAGGPGDDVDPAWSPDGTRVAFASDRGGRYAIWEVAAAGGTAALVADTDGDARAPAWRRGGQQLAYSGSTAAGTHIWTVDLATLTPVRVTGSQGTDLRPDWAPGGERLAFTRVDGTGRRTWVVDPGGGPATPVAGTGGDLDPDWALAQSALAPGPEQRLPDLDQRAPTDLRVVSVGGRYRLGFTSRVENLGRGPLRIRGWRPAGSPVMRADQLIELLGGGTTTALAVGTLRYETHPPHRHWHFQEFERYELRTAVGHRLVGLDRKSGFCLIDRYGRTSVRVPDAGLPRFLSDCGAGQPTLRRVEQGSSPGYIDRYPAFFHGQDIDVTDAPAGTYVLVHRANPGLRVRESAYSNDAASLRIRLTWPGGRSAPPRVAILRRCEAGEHCPATT